MAGASGTGRTLFILSSSFSSRLSRHTKRFLFPTLSNPITLFPRFRPLSSITTFPETIDSENAKHSMLLERLRIRHLKDSGKVTETKSLQKKGVVDESEIGKKKKVVNFGSFEELGLSDEVMGAVREMGIQIPTEIQCIGVPAVLDEKSVVLGSHTGSGKTLAYLLPLVQMLRRDEELNGILLKPKRPRAVVLCPTRELSEQVFRVAKSISHHAIFRCTMVSGGGRLKPQEDSLCNPVDMVVGTPGRILQHIEEGNIVYGDIKYLVLDEADTMFDRGFGPDIHKFLAPLKHRASKPGSLGFQTILVTATMTTAVQKMVDEEFQGIEHLRTSTLHKKISSARHDFIRLAGSENKMDSLLQVLEPSLAKGNRMMVFCNTLDSSRAMDHFLGGNQTTFFYSTTSKSQRDLMLLQKFKERKLKGSSKDSKGIPKISSLGFDSDDHNKGLKNESVKEQEQEEKGDNVVVGGFKELGLSEEVVEVMDEIGEFVPSEIQCVVIPTVLEGKCVLLSSPSTPDRTLAYLLPIIQLLRRDKELLGSNSKHPRALVLCASEEKAEQCFNAAAHIIRNAELKSAKNRASSNNEKSNSSIGLMIGTPSEILQYIEEGVVVPAELNYLVLDEADFLLDSNLGDEIHKIIRSLRHDESKSTVKKLQTILAISTIAEVLGEKSPLVQRLERDHAGIVSAMSLEMEQTEVFHFIESLDAFKKKLAEAMTSL